jgi:alkylation response protein AidB-like acyl-CoA dehydrogenase
MDTRFSDADNAFGEEVRKFLATDFDEGLAARIADPKTFKAASVEWQKRLFARGWIAPNWPVEYGGTGWSAAHKYIFANELAAVGAPEVLPFGVKMVGPVIYAFGTPEQKARFLPGILDSDTWWCQGYSEPGAGSDLASLQMRALRDGEVYRVTGTKIWTTYAQYADWIFCLVRTDPAARAQQGISFLLIDMRSPGITVNPIHTIDGHHSLNEVVFDNVEVPVENRIGEENRGWTCAKFLLSNERSALAGIAYCKRILQRLKLQAADAGFYSRPLIRDADFQARLADVEMDLMALEFTELRVLAAMADGGNPGPEASLLKLKGTELQQAIHQLSLQFGAYAGGTVRSSLPDSVCNSWHQFGDSVRFDYLYGRASTIYGGSNEVQKNIIAKAVLGL